MVIETRSSLIMMIQVFDDVLVSLSECKDMIASLTTRLQSRVSVHECVSGSYQLIVCIKQVYPEQY